jgi:heme a synthase
MKSSMAESLSGSSRAATFRTAIFARPASSDDVGLALSLGRLAGHLAIATLVLMAIGSATRVMNAGLACPDWPLCYGTLFPGAQMNLRVFLEWFHRLDAAIVGGGTIALTVLSWLGHRELPRWLPWAATACLGLVLSQGLLGALTVTQLLRFDIVTAHLGTALLFFCALLTIHLLLRPYQPIGTVGRLGWISGAGALLVYGQSLLGGLVASQWAAHQCLADSGSAGSGLCQVLHSHFAGVVPPTIAAIVLVVLAWRTPALAPPLRNLTLGIAGTLLAQIGLGLSVLRLHLQVEPLTVLHQLMGATLLALFLSFTVLAWRDRRPTLGLAPQTID